MSKCLGSLCFSGAVRAAALAAALALVCCAGPHPGAGWWEDGGPPVGQVPSGCMSTTLSPVSPPQFPASLTVPADGDACNAASVNAATQKLLDAADAARQLGALARQPTRAYSYDGTHLQLQAFSPYLVTVSGVWTMLALASTNLDLAATFGGVLANSTRYYIYAGYSGGVAAYQVTTTAPDGSLLWKNGTTDWAYVTNVLTDAGGVVVPFWDVGGRYRYASGTGGPSNDLRVVNAGAAVGAWTDVASLSPMPSYARHGYFQAINTVATGTTSLRPKGVTAANWNTSHSDFTVPANTYAFPLDTPIGPSGIQYNQSGAGQILNLYVIGYDW